LRNWEPVTRAALAEAGVEAGAIEAVAATRGPGLPTALIMGLKAGQACAYALGVPFFGIHHHEAHLYSPWVGGSPPRSQFDRFEPNVSLIASGGHTILAFVTEEQQHRVLGSTLDDAAGECFDKTGKLMGLPYPAGPHLDQLASQGNPLRWKFPRPKLNDPDDDFSFSGLKTSVRYCLRDHPGLLEDTQALRDFCASVQAAIVDVLAGKTVRAAKRNRVRCITASGGVTCNSGLRRALQEACERERLTLRLAEKSMCTDNAAMIGVLAERKLQLGVPPTDIDADILPVWPL
jgi:N6-L-threonylcarbamoyladenine synthase